MGRYVTGSVFPADFTFPPIQVGVPSWQAKLSLMPASLLKPLTAWILETEGKHNALNPKPPVS